MKRRVVAIFLSLTLCMGGTLEAGAAALESTDVQMAAETAGDPAEDVFSDEAETTVQQPETEADQTGSTDSTDSSEETPVTPENPAETPDVIETPEITETPETTEAPEATEAPDATTEDSTDPGDDFSAGDAQELDAPSADTAVQNKVENNKAEETSATGASLVNGVVVAKTSDWVSANGFYRLRKKKVAASAAPEGKASEDPAESSEEEQKTTVDETAAAAQEVQQTEELPDGAAESEQAQVLQNESAEGEQETAAEEVSTEEVSAAEASAETASADVVSAEETSAETAPVETETAVETSESVDNAETLAQDEGNASQVSETGSIEDNYFTAQDGLLKINTNGHVGYYLFNEDGYLVTGRMTREPGAAGYTGTQKTEWYFLENSKASLYSDSTGKAITPEPEVWADGVQLEKDKDYTVSYEDNINAGVAKLVITASGTHYAGTKELSFQILRKSIHLCDIGSIQTQVYTGSDIKPTVTVEDDGKTLELLSDYTLMYSNNRKAGTGVAAVAGKGNYTATKNLTFDIRPCDAGAAVVTGASADSLSISWTGDGAVTGYEVYRAGADGKWQQVTRTRDAFYTDKKLAAETTYSYKVRSYLVADGETYYGEFTGAVTGTTTK